MAEFTIAAHEARAEECVRLANLTDDKILCAEILTLRQRHLENARRLREMEQAKAAPASKRG